MDRRHLDGRRAHQLPDRLREIAAHVTAQRLNAWVRRGLVVVAVVLCVGAPASVARADGDPASDVLPIQDVFTAYPPPSNVHGLNASVQKAFAAGNRVKVAVIASRRDLGSIPSLFGKAGAYAKFLGQELGPFYSGPLLIVMPSGYGIFDEGHSTRAETAVLAKLKVAGKSESDLVSSAESAVDRLEAAGALKSPDTQAPTVYPAFATVHPGQRAKLVFHVLENSERASAVVTVYAGQKSLAVLHSPMQSATYASSVTVTWNVPSSVPKKGVRFCVVATDPSGNRTPKPTCSPIAVH